MKFNIRKLKESDWDTLVKWWDSWPEWVAPPKTFSTRKWYWWINSRKR